MSMLNTGYAEVNGTRLYYESAGEGFPLVLIHGFGADSRIWDSQVPPFAEHFRVIRYDARGFGKSALPTDQPYTPPDDLKALLDYLNIFHAHIMGQSMGGEIAIDFALAYPAVTRSLVLADPAIGGHQWSAAYQEAMGPIGAVIIASGFKAAIDLLMAHPLHVPIAEQPAAGATLRHILESYSGWHITHTDPWKHPDPPAIQRLTEITAPTLILSGERSVPDFQQMAAALERDVPNARKVVLPGVGHVIPLEAPKAVNELTLKFLASV